MRKPNIFWLHIKKAGGTSMRDQFNAFYTLQKNRYSYPLPFVAQPKEMWNDTLNNYRIPLGHYDYRRMLFAKKFLYTPEEFEAMFKFVVVRNPYDRIVSAWKYLFRMRFYDVGYQCMKRSFRHFLERIPFYMKQRYRQYYHKGYIGLHVAPVWPDITDESGKVLVDQIIKLENFNEEIKPINQKFGLNIELTVHKNKGKRRKHYTEYYNKKTRELVEKIYADDLKHLGYEFGE